MLSCAISFPYGQVSMATYTHKWVRVSPLSEVKWRSRAPAYMALLALPTKYISAKTRMTSSRLTVGNILHAITQTMTINCLDFDTLVHAKNMPGSMLVINSMDSFRPVLVPQLIISLLIVYIAYDLIISTMLCENFISIHLITLFFIISLNISMYSGETYVLKQIFTEGNCYF